MGELFHPQDFIQGAPLLFSGFLNTVALSAVAVLGGGPLGLLLGLARHRRLPVLGAAATFYIEFIRSVPLILLLVFIHYGLLPMLTGRPGFFGSAVLTFIVFEAAYFAEIFRGGFQALKPEEVDAALSLGLPPVQRYRFVFLPLVLRRITPALVNQCVTLIKDTSLASILGVIELTRAGEIIYERTYHDFEILMFTAMVYFAVCWSLSRWSRRFEAESGNLEPMLAKSL